MKIYILLLLSLGLASGTHANKIDDIKNAGEDIKNAVDLAKQLAAEALSSADDQLKQVFAKMAAEFKTIAGDALGQLKNLGGDLEKEEKETFDQIKAESEKIIGEISPLLGPLEGLAKEGLESAKSCEDVLKAGLKMPLIFVGNESARAVLDAANAVLENARASLNLESEGVKEIGIPLGDKIFKVERKVLEAYEKGGIDIKELKASATVSPAKLTIHAIVVVEGKEHTIDIDPKAIQTGNVTHVANNIAAQILTQLGKVI